MVKLPKVRTLANALLLTFVLFSLFSVRGILEYTWKEIEVEERKLKLLFDKSNQHNLTVNFEGRLGNNLFEYAALMSIAETNGYRVVLPREINSDLYDVFPKLQNQTKVEWKYVTETYSNFTEVSYPSIGFYDERSEHLKVHLRNRRTNVMLNGTYQSYKYFMRYEDKIRSQLVFSPHLKKKAKKVIKKLQPKNQKTRIPIIGIHIRRGDFLWGYYKDLGYVVASKGYFIKAMDFMRRKHGPVRFIIASNDIPWAKRNLGHRDVFYSPFKGPGEDLALLAHCDHVIVSVGSFGWWAAWLANGTTVYCDKFPLPKSTLGGHFRKDDYYMPNWVPMS